MAFNSNSYRANKARREAWATLAQAKEIKALAQSNERHAWRLPRVEHHVRIARSLMHESLIYRRLRALTA